MTSDANPTLRLVGQQDAESVLAWSVARENRAAAAAVDLDPTDPRWALAVRVSAELQGTVLTPERRKRVMTTARALGVRPFEANMIIALVQDGARRGQPLSATAPQIGIVPSPPPRSAHLHAWRLLTAVCLAAVITALVIRWFVS